MNHGIQFNTEEGYALVVTGGKADADGFVRLMRELWEHPAWPAGVNLLIDHRALDSTGLTAADIQQIARIRESHRGRMPFRRIASVVETDLGFGLTRMWDFYTDHDQTREHRIFRSIDEAKRWVRGSESNEAEAAE